MPALTIPDIDAALSARLLAWAESSGHSLPALARSILAAADRTRENYDPNVNVGTRDIRRSRDGGCGLCDELEPLLDPQGAMREAHRTHRAG